ncbi:uncharacterized protein LOC119677693 isoform X2 [Teleopsis dalmanni]|uniref:uncharacterized protein LOC119677693 isoform X2 n=1 Tax=Teleopsis dalmanni TaxID=139649 RepID=UPI0018CF69A9|nr:uncharacterized protein LOC119677693 isoform X2 [Teleopsis dalmanni]
MATLSERNLEKWDNLSDFDKLEFLFNPLNPPDCIFVVGISEKEIQHIPCHKRVLMDVSLVFATMFDGKYLESESNCEIRLDDVEPIAFEQFKNFIYYGNKPILNSLNDCLQLIYLSQKYEINSLLNECLVTIKERMKYITVLNLAEFFNSPLFITHRALIQSINLMRENNDLLRTSQIYNIPAPRFIMLMDKLSSLLSKSELFQMVENYIEKNYMSQHVNNMNLNNGKLSYSVQHIITTLLSKINILNMSAKEFCAGPLHCSFIDPSTKLSLLVSISKGVLEKYTIRTEMIKSMLCGSSKDSNAADNGTTDNFGFQQQKHANPFALSSSKDSNATDNRTTNIFQSRSIAVPFRRGSSKGSNATDNRTTNIFQSTRSAVPFALGGSSKGSNATDYSTTNIFQSTRSAVPFGLGSSKGSNATDNRTTNIFQSTRSAVPFALSGSSKDSNATGN